MRYKLWVSAAVALGALVVGLGTWSLRGPAQPAPSVLPDSRPAASAGQRGAASAPAASAATAGPTVTAAAGVGAGAASAGSGAEAGSAPSTPPAPVECLDLVPAETLLCWYGRPFPDTAAPDAPNAVQLLLEWVPHALNNRDRLWARGLEAFNLAIRYPHVLALIDARAKLDESRNPPIPRGDRIRFALIVDVAGDDEAFARVIQAAINEQTDRDNSTLTRQQAGRWSYMELRDTRLPDWCTIAWGNIGSFFVFAIGPEVWPSIAAVAGGRQEALSHTGWLERVRDDRARHALIEIIVRAQEIRERLDPFVDGRATAFFSAWQAEDIERSHWALGFEGRAMYCVANFIENGQPRQRLLADPNIDNPDLLATIPEGARYAIYHVPPAEVLPRFFNGLLATRTAAERRNVHRLWKRIQQERGFDADRDILAHMGEYIVMHNDPPHPLHIPLAMTTLTEIRDEPAQVSRAIDALSEAWRDAQQKFQEANGEGPNNMLIDRDNDGIWYVKFGPGLAGPAWLVTDKFLITSWSPTALRMYLDKIGDRAGRRLRE
jgi:hypothetical protein